MAHRHLMPVEEKETKQLPVLAHSGRNVSSSKEVYVAISRSLTTEDRSALYTCLKEYGRFTGLCWLMSPEPAPPAQLPIPTIEEIIYSEDFLQAIGAQQQLDVLVRKA